MPIEFHCPGCGKLMRTPDETAGRKGKCPHCGTKVQIPDTSLAAPAPPAGSASVARRFLCGARVTCGHDPVLLCQLRRAAAGARRERGQARPLPKMRCGHPDSAGPGRICASCRKTENKVEGLSHPGSGGHADPVRLPGLPQDGARPRVGRRKPRQVPALCRGRDDSGGEFDRGRFGGTDAHPGWRRADSAGNGRSHAVAAQWRGRSVRRSAGSERGVERSVRRDSRRFPAVELRVEAGGQVPLGAERPPIPTHLRWLPPAGREPRATPTNRNGAGCLGTTANGRTLRFGVRLSSYSARPRRRFT